MAGFTTLPLKSGWRGLVVAVLALVLFSMLAPLGFLLGFHNPGRLPESRELNSENEYRSLDKILKRLSPELPKGFILNDVTALDDKINTTGLLKVIGVPQSPDPNFGGLPIQPAGVLKQSPSPPAKVGLDSNKEKVDTAAETTDLVKGVSTDETTKSCQLEFGSYCSWKKENKEEMKDSMVKRLKDQLFVARAYFPIIAKLPSQDMLSREMRQNIQEFERIFSEAATDTDLPLDIEKKRQKMEEVITKAKSFPVDCTYIDRKLRQILDLTEDEGYFHMKQSAFLYQLAVQTKPKSHHCLSMRLTVEYFTSYSFDKEILLDGKHGNPSFYHYVIFSNNVLAASVVINSTVVHAKESEKLVFHLITNGQNYFAMKLWFLRSPFRNAKVFVLNMEDLNLSNLHSSEPHLYFSDEFRVSVRKPPSLQMRTEYISVFGPAHFMLPELFQNLERVVVLDDDVVVQSDLSPLWSLDMEGKVNGAVEFCGLRFGQLKSYLNGNIYNSNSCVWMSGLNVVDLKKWRQLNLTKTYQRLLQTLRESNNGALSSVRALPATLLTFHNQIYALNSSWALSGLGHNYGVDIQTIRESAVLHYNGNMKPWLHLGIPKYRRYWKKFLKRGDQYMDECNVNP